MQSGWDASRLPVVVVRNHSSIPVLASSDLVVWSLLEQQHSEVVTSMRQAGTVLLPCVVADSCTRADCVSARCMSVSG